MGLFDDDKPFVPQRRRRTNQQIYDDAVAKEKRLDAVVAGGVEIAKFVAGDSGLLLLSVVLGESVMGEDNVDDLSHDDLRVSCRKSLARLGYVELKNDTRKDGRWSVVGSDGKSRRDRVYVESAMFLDEEKRKALFSEALKMKRRIRKKHAKGWDDV